MITVVLPVSLQLGTGDRVLVAEPISTLSELLDALERRMPGFRDQYEDAMFNFAVNDELVLRGVMNRQLADGDRVEIVPAISGG
jgi:molybdopterin converting factor small subunit